MDTRATEQPVWTVRAAFLTQGDKPQIAVFCISDGRKKKTQTSHPAIQKHSLTVVLQIIEPANLEKTCKIMEFKH